MNHFLFDIFFPILIAVLIGNVAFIIGRVILNFFKLESFKHGIQSSSLSILIGYSIIAYLSLGLSLIGPLNKFVIWGIFIVIFCLGRRFIFCLYKQSYEFIKIRPKYDVVEKSLLILLIGCFLFYLSSALVPPYRTDAIAYHLPEAKEIAVHGIRVLWVVGSFFGNLPILMETLYASLYVVCGFTVINLTHYFILIAALFFVYDFMRLAFNKKAAMLSILGIFTIYELFVDATSAYIDAAMIAYEIVGFLLLILWMQNKNKVFLLISGALYGLAAAIKYNALYGLVIACLLLLVHSLSKKAGFKEIIKNILLFSLAIFIMAGFWYIKNFLLYGNPTYPFYFGHVGYTDQRYMDTINTIKLFSVDRSLLNFVTLPFHFFLSSYHLSSLLVFFFWPVLLIFSFKKIKENAFLMFASLYVLIYLMVWFFFATHQIRFVLVPIIMLFMFFGVQFEIFLREVLSIINYKILIVVGLAVLLLFGYKVITAKSNYFLEVKKTELSYILGKYSKADFYEHRNLGTIYKVSEYINSNYHDTKFLNIWGDSDFFISSNNRFISPEKVYYSEQFSTSTLVDFLRKEKILYGLVDNYEKSQAFNEPVRITNPASVEYGNFSLLMESIVKRVGRQIYNQSGSEIYKFDFVE